MNRFIPKIKLLLLILISPLFSFLNGNIGVSDLSEMSYLLDLQSTSQPISEDKDASEKDFSLDQLSIFAVHSSSDTAESVTNKTLDILPDFSSEHLNLSELSKRVFLIAHHFQSSYLHGYHQSYTLARHLLWQVFLI